MDNDYNRHPTHGIKTPKYRLKSRKSFLKTSTAIASSGTEEKVKRWKQIMLEIKEKRNNVSTEPREELHKGKNLPWSL